ncbi:cofilin-like [Asterias rubens]|uniref:cofilin-like n=1 Tax=Asterias rubens TaxID=7604 RepID=UPI001455C7D1|nr:cofilin-like [Asterias rubens]
MFAIRAVLFFPLVINVLVNGYQEDNANGELKVLLKRLQERLEDEERGYELQDLKERWGSMSGVEVGPDVSATCNDMMLTNNYKWVTFKIENSVVVLDKTSAPRGIEDDEAQFNEMKNALTSQPRYVFFDFYITSNTGHEIRKVVLVLWIDEKRSRFFDRMAYASNENNVKDACPGLSMDFSAGSKSDLNYETYRAKVMKLSR